MQKRRGPKGGDIEESFEEKFGCDGCIERNNIEWEIREGVGQ